MSSPVEVPSSFGELGERGLIINSAEIVAMS